MTFDKMEETEFWKASSIKLKNKLERILYYIEPQLGNQDSGEMCKYIESIIREEV